MTIQTPTIEEFLAQAVPDEADQLQLDPLESIAASLRAITEIVVRRDTQEAVEDETKQAFDQLDQEYAELNQEADRRQQVIDDILDVCAKSKGQLAEKVRAVVDAAFAVVGQGAPEDAAPAPESQPKRLEEPERDAPVEQWRVYAGQEGFSWPETEGMNRSQIRTLLRISNGSTE